MINVNKGYVSLLKTQKNILGISPLRFVPKTKKIRPIINLSSHKYNKISINQQLNNIYHIIKYECDKNELFNNCLFGMNDIYKYIYLIYRPFYNYKKSFNNKCILLYIKDENLFYMTLDITACYDNINPV